ncbi:MAG: radical SAM protein [Thermodesulfobacteriota bacterium]
MAPLVVFVQLPPPRFVFQEIPANIPLAAGFLVTALNRRQPGRFESVIVPTHVVDVLADSGLADYLADLRPHVLALSLYVWNVQRSLYLASAVRRLSPETRVVVGGPEVTPDNLWVMEHPAVDAGVFGEGESRILELLGTVLPGNRTGKMTVPPGNVSISPIAANLATAEFDISGSYPPPPTPSLDGRAIRKPSPLEGEGMVRGEDDEATRALKSAPMSISPTGAAGMHGQVSMRTDRPASPLGKMGLPSGRADVQSGRVGMSAGGRADAHPRLSGPHETVRVPPGGIPTRSGKVGVSKGTMPVAPDRVSQIPARPAGPTLRPVDRFIAGAFVKTDRGIVVDAGPAPSWDLSLGDDPYLSRAVGPSLDGTLFLETLRGCPFKCGYCYYHKAFPGIRHHPEDSIERVLDMAYSQASDVHEIYLMDPSFNAAPRFRKLLSGLARRRTQRDVALHTELRSDLIDPGDAAAFEVAGLKSAEVGLQSSDPQVLRTAGRTSDPDAIARGVRYLKNRNIDVTTGIILGLPGDSPEGFSATLAWLQEREAYSVVHPFVLSVLPGTDFRSRASELGLTYDSHPPYYVRSTASFSRDAFRDALRECEETFDMEIDHIPLPSLVDQGPGVVSDPDRASYVSKWILDPSDSPRARKLVETVARKAADPFTFWFKGAKGSAAESQMIDLMARFCALNPHCVVRVVLEFEELPDPRFFGRAVNAAVHPGLYLNRYYEPLLGHDEVISLDFTLMVPLERARLRRQLLEEEYLRHAAIVCDVGRPFDVDLDGIEFPILVSCEVELTLADELLGLLLRHVRDRADEVRFRRGELAAKWDYLTRESPRKVEFSEQILRT